MRWRNRGGDREVKNRREKGFVTNLNGRKM
jgi:hypothetical protein